MLEWYRAGAGYLDAIAETRELLAAVAQAVTGGTVLRRRGRNVDVAGEWTCLTVAEAFDRWAGWNPCLHYDADRFDLDLVEKIEPALPPDRPAVLKDYPAPAAALARCRAGTPPVAERWELYVAGMELANAFSELTDAEEQRRRFEACAASRRRAGRDVYALDEAFLAALARGLPACSGVALGVDRLVMLVTGAEAILDVRVCGGETRAAAGGRDEVIAQKLL
jgi:lysyl-tRNA synthetase class 2